MFKGFEFNKECRKIMDKSIYAEEHGILSDFLATDNENVCLEYGSEKEAHNACSALSMWRKKNRKPLKIVQREKYVFAFKTIADETERG